MLSPDKRIIVVLLASTLILFSTIATASVGGYDNSGQPPNYGDIAGNYAGDDVTFEIVESEEDTFIIEDYRVTIEGNNYQIFEKIEIDTEESWAPISVEQEGDTFQFGNEHFDIQIEDGELEIGNHFKQGMILRVCITLGSDVSLTENMTLEINDTYDVNFNLDGDVEFQIEKESGTPPKYNFELGEEGDIQAYIKEIVDDFPPRGPRNRPLPPITIGRDGTMQPPGPESGLMVVEREIKRGSVDLDISGEFEGSRIVRVSIDREMVGRNISDFDDIVVEVDGEELDHFDPWQDIYETDEPGYYVNMTKSQTEVYVRMDFSEHNLRIYERTVEDVISPYSYVGLLIGALVVIAGAGLLFKKKS